MKVLAFGDSFVKMFLHCEPEVKHWKFKGKSVKGLVKESDIERRKIQRQIRKAPNGTKILLFFGQVDFNYVRYYKVIKGEPPISQQTFKKYVEWVSTMNYHKNISIVSIFPTPIKKQFIVPSLISKGSYTVQQQNAEIDAKILSQFQKTPETWQLWNSWISQHCKKNRVDNLTLFSKNHLEPQFYDVSNLTIHLRYVPVLRLVQKFINISIDLTKAEQIQKLYEKEKAHRIVNSNFRVVNSLDEQNRIIQTTFQQIQKQKTQPQQKQKQQQLKSQINQKQKTSQSTNLSQQNLVLFTPAQNSENKLTLSSPQSFQPNNQQLLQQANIKNMRKFTADLDTDTNIQKDRSRSKSKQQKNIRQSSQEKSLQKQQQTVTDQKGKKKKKKGNKKKNNKQKKKYVCVDQSDHKKDSDDEGQMFFMLSKMSNKVKKRNS